jgi:hypothetical protein
MGLFSSAAKRCSNGKKFLRSAGACCCSPSASAPAGGVRGKEEASTSAPASAPADSKKKRWRKRKFWRKKKKAKKESGDGSGELADLVNNISANSGKPVIHPSNSHSYAMQMDAEARPMRAWLMMLCCMQTCART